MMYRLATIEAQILKERDDQTLQLIDAGPFLVKMLQDIRNLFGDSGGQLPETFKGDSFAFENGGKPLTNILQDKEDQGLRAILRQCLKFSAQRLQFFLVEIAC
jgi:hypothetical protein